MFIRNAANKEAASHNGLISCFDWQLFFALIFFFDLLLDYPGYFEGILALKVFII